MHVQTMLILQHVSGCVGLAARILPQCEKLAGRHPPKHKRPGLTCSYVAPLPRFCPTVCCCSYGFFPHPSGSVPSCSILMEDAGISASACRNFCCFAASATAVAAAAVAAAAVLAAAAAIAATWGSPAWPIPARLLPPLAPVTAAPEGPMISCSLAPAAAAAAAALSAAAVAILPASLSLGMTEPKLMKRVARGPAPRSGLA
jgi:hypothetical protein